MRQSIVSLALALAAQACGKSSEECQVNVADFVEYLHTMKDEPQGIATSARLPVRADANEEVRTVLVVEVAPTGIRLDGTPVDASSLPNRIIDRNMQLSRSSTTFRVEHIWFAIDEATPWNVVVDLVNATAEAGYMSIGFVFGVPSNVRPPARTQVDDEIAKLSSQERPAGLAKILREVTAPCKGIQDVFQNLATYETGNKVEIFASGVGKALLDCKCNVDIKKLRSAAYHVFAGAPMRGIAITVRREYTTPLALPAAMTWAEASKHLTPKMATSFAVR